MLGPDSSFAEAVALRENQAKAEPYKLSLEDDDIHAMAVMLSVMHPRAGDTPKTINFKQLKEMAVICDKYDCAAAMKPWDGMWMQQWLKLATEDGFEEWLFISVVFRVQAVFEALTQKFSRCCILSPYSDHLAFPSAASGLCNKHTKLDGYTPDSVVGMF
jgi:hypothetical protein